MLYAFALFAAEEAAKAEQPSLIAQLGPPFLLMAAVFYFLILAPQRREKRLREELLGRIKKNDRVVTHGGILATVANIKDEEVTLRIDDTTNARLTVLRSSIARILTAEDQTKTATASGVAPSANIKAS